MNDMDRECKNCGKTKFNHIHHKVESTIYYLCYVPKASDMQFEPVTHERVPVGFVDAVRKLVNAVWNDVDGGSIRLDKALQSVESMLSDMDKKEDV